MAEVYDKTHRLLFGFPRMIEDLIRLCLGGDWLERLDFSTLEKVPERLLSPELMRREQDVLWRLRYRPEGGSEDDWFYVYLHLEHMSRPRRLMALDTTTYKLLVLQELARRRALTSSKKLPPILSVVFYTGAKSWRAPTSLLDLLRRLPGAPQGLDLWSYRLVDAQRYPLEDLIGVDSPLLGLFRLERLEEIDDLPKMARELKGTLAPEDQDLAAAFVELINEVVLLRLTPEGAPRIRITDLDEVPSMLEQRIESITRGWEMKGWRKGQAEGREEGRAKGREEGRAKGREEGRAKGREEGRAEGREEGQLEEAAHLFLELFAAKHGAVPARVRERVSSAGKEQLETWAKRLVRTESPEEVFKD